MLKTKINNSTCFPMKEDDFHALFILLQNSALKL